MLESELGYDISWKVVDGKRWTPEHRERIYTVGFREDVGFKWPDESAWPEPFSNWRGLLPRCRNSRVAGP
ncbi:DNA cytosine methyltransferase [Paraburkholderia hospita]|uniref:DNA cytosine methyltransferase n=1 Tax=Paraburkholderia hospita TaxID=169430 RepID=UPI001EE647FB